jgi:hypothetical protein
MFLAPRANEAAHERDCRQDKERDGPRGPNFVHADVYAEDAHACPLLASYVQAAALE